jgi:hypothetical protein
MAQLTKMRQGGVIVSAEPSRVDFLLKAGWVIVEEGAGDEPVPTAVDSAEEGTPEEETPKAGSKRKVTHVRN